jgi:hypothetical protein
LSDLQFVYSIEKTPRGFHYWLTFDKVPSIQQKEFIYDRIEAVLPGIEARHFDTGYAIRFPGMYKDFKSYTIDLETGKEFRTFQQVCDFLYKRVNKVDTLPSGDIVPIKKTTPTVDAIGVDSVPTVNITKANYKILKETVGFVAKKRKSFHTSKS